MFTCKLLAIVSAISLPSALAFGAQPRNTADTGAVFVMTNSNSGNKILRFKRRADGSLAPVGSTYTGGNGSGGKVDPLGSQNSLLLTADASVLLAVNAASGTISSFRVDGANLQLADVESSGGSFPNAIAQWGDLVYVLNGAGSSNVVGFRLEDGKLIRIPNAVGYLSSTIAAGSSISFNADGRVLLVAERSTGRIDSFPVNANGSLGAPTITPYPNVFDFTIAPGSDLLVTVGGPTMTSSVVADDGTVNIVNSTNIVSGACWIVVTPSGFAYGSAGGSHIIDGYSISPSGAFTPIGTGNVATVPNGILLDLALSSDGKYLYSVNEGTASIGAWSIDQNTGALTALPFVTLPASYSFAGLNGIAAY